MEQKIIGQIARISKYAFILNSIPNLECFNNQDKHSIHVILYENEEPVLDEVIEKIRIKSKDYINTQINLLCDKLQLYRIKYKKI